MRTKLLAFMCMLFIFSAAFVGCGQNNASLKDENPAPESPSAKELILATTTSTYDSGLLDYLLPFFEAEHNYIVKVISLGTGQALETAKNGDADVVLVHAKATELEMVAEGHFVDRHDVMYNDFIVVGPAGDPAGVSELTEISDVFNALAEQKAIFVSRGDDSGTHKKEASLWEAAGISANGDWYVSVGGGMGDTLRIADEMEGYTLTDRATYLSLLDSLDLVIVFEGNPQLFNQYGVMAVNPDNYSDINYDGAKAFIDFMISENGQELIAGFKPFGDTLFFPNAN